MPYKQKPVEKLYWTIGEVAGELQVNSSVLRYWEKEFGVLRPRRDSKGDRSYTRDDIRKLQMIRYLLKDRGFTIQGAREHLRSDPESTEQLAELRERLERVRSLLAGVRDQLENAST